MRSVLAVALLLCATPAAGAPRSHHRALAAVEASHVSERGDGPFRCADAEDSRPNCTRCAPGWRGRACNVRVFAAPCTPHHCLDWSRCAWGAPLTLHVYAPPPTAEAAYVQQRRSAAWLDMLAAFRRSGRHEDNASRACLFLPWFDTLCAADECASPTVDSPKADWLIRAVERLPHWSGGANHVLFDAGSAHAPRLPVRRGFYMAAAFWAAGAGYRHGHDQPLPRWHAAWEALASADAAAQRASEARSRLLVLSGGREDGCTACAPADLAAALQAQQYPQLRTRDWVRDQLRLLHNGVDIVTEGDSSLALLRDSTFGLVLPGVAAASNALAEALACGAIPVIASDFIMLPFAQLLDWHAFSVRVSESHLPLLPLLLRNMTRVRVARMRAAAVAAYERCFATPGKVALCGIEQLEASLFSGVTG